MTMLKILLAIPALFATQANAPGSHAHLPGVANPAPQTIRTPGKPRFREGANHYNLQCGPNKCVIEAAEFSFDVEKAGAMITIKPRTFTNDPHGMLIRNGSKVDQTQLSFVPEKIFPGGGHYLVGPGDDIIEWIKGRDGVARISAREFIDRIRHTRSLYIISSQRMGYDTIGSETVKIRTADFVKIVERARKKLR
ncbi:MAG: hypothetical protein JHD35_19195 [Sphingopyxis sp.]|nr:hypothetical protein [Sphingopyxis sp.]